MLTPRVIPCLLLQNNALVKTVNFSNPKYIGDPLNAVKIFNEKEADELMVLDIDASKKQLEPNYRLIELLAAECRMPLCYGGGIKSDEQALKIFNLGVEKISLSSGALADITLVSRIASKVGRQSVVVTLDVIRNSGSFDYDIFVNNGTVRTGFSLIDFALRLEKEGVGEIVVNAISLDGTQRGYDLDLIKSLKDHLTVPVTILGGAKDLYDLRQVINQCGLMGLAAGSLFVFKGKFRAVLINYPSVMEKNELFKQSL